MLCDHSAILKDKTSESRAQITQMEVHLRPDSQVDASKSDSSIAYELIVCVQCLAVDLSVLRWSVTPMLPYTGYTYVVTSSAIRLNELPS